MSNTIISCTKCAQEFSGNQIFENISFSITGNKKVGLVGKNGVGKTTLFSIISQKRKPSSGHVTIKGTIGFVPQEVEFGATVTVKSYLRNFVESWEQYRINEMLDKVALTGIEQDSLIANLSGGQQKKVAFAKVLLEECDILLLDEPTNHLDIETRESIEEMLQNYEGAILVVSHDTYFVSEIGVNRVREVRDGKIVEG